MDDRRRFLESFLAALGARRVVVSEDTQTHISGTVIYDPSDPDETQEFRWNLDRGAAPSNDAWRLAKFLGDEALLSIDKVTISRRELRARFNAVTAEPLSIAAFDTIMEELLSVEVGMIDDGVESDAYFIHE